ncbi:MAG TPA: protein kinase [Kofleriaceae bacterium]|nr:protein kinase [Kofleriaceae bacterium]
MTSLNETTPFARDDEPTGEPFGPYVVYEKLGEGGMAYVHRAELVGDNGLRKPVALKRLLTNAAEDPDFVASFVHEAQLAAKLKHPNIVQAYDLGKLDNTYYIAMELVPGPTLAQVMTQAHNGAGAVPLPIALEILIQLCDALDHAHDLRDDGGRRLDLVHRDVNPMNVIVSRTGVVKLIDFGIAKARSASRVTEVGIIKGKHAYVAPEYTYGKLDHRADLFGLGVLAHELLTGRRLFLGETDLQTIRNVREMIVPPPSRFAPDISTQLDAIVLKALERDPNERWQTANEMRTALTEERHRLGVAITGRQIREWAEWAFQQAPRRETSINRMLDGLEPSISIERPLESTSERAETMQGTGVKTALRQPTAPTVPIGRLSEDDVLTEAVLPRVANDDDVPTEALLPANDDDMPTVDQRAPTPVPVRLHRSAALIPNRPATVARSLADECPPVPRALAATAVAPAPKPRALLVATPATGSRAYLVPAPAPVVAKPLVVANGTGPTSVPNEQLAVGSGPTARPPVRVGPALVVTTPVVAKAPAAAQPAKRRPRAPAWRPPTRWAHPQKRRSPAPFFILLGLIGLAAVLVSQGYIDIERWREIIATYIG